eukprot:Skav232443  [mRNA]  locus=scaffold189:338234:343452:+ [translate_table: standard]
MFHPLMSQPSKQLVSSQVKNQNFSLLVLSSFLILPSMGWRCDVKFLLLLIHHEPDGMSHWNPPRNRIKVADHCHHVRLRHGEVKTFVIAGDATVSDTGPVAKVSMQVELDAVARGQSVRVGQIETHHCARVLRRGDEFVAKERQSIWVHQNRAPVLLLELPHTMLIARTILQDAGVKLQSLGHEETAIF